MKIFIILFLYARIYFFLKLEIFPRYRIIEAEEKEKLPEAL